MDAITKPKRHLRTARAVSDFIGRAPAPKAMRSAQESVRESAWIWFLCFTSFVGLQAIQRVGTIGAVVFLTPWALIAAPRLPALMTGLRCDWPMLVLPLWATASTLWSPVPAITLRAALEYCATAVIGIAAARCVQLRTVMTSMMAALALFTAAGLARSGHREIGLYTSHNQMADFSALALIIAGAFVFTKRRTWFMRCIFVALATIGAAGVTYGHSGGAFVALYLSIALTAGLRWRIFRSLPGKLAGFFGGAVMITALLYVGLSAIYVGALAGLGKDGTLTGRTDLWREGLHQIGFHPLKGVGYAAFWVPANVAAEKLWAAFGIGSKVGFHFHNTFINVAVDIGILPALFLALILIKTVGGCLQADWLQNDACRPSLACVFLFIFLLSFIEAEFTYMFSVSLVLFCISWVQFCAATARHRLL